MAAQALEGKLVMQQSAKTTVAQPAQEDPLPPLPKSWFQPQTVKDITAMSREDFRRCYHAAPPWGDNFRKRVELIYAREGKGTNQHGWRR